MGPCWQPAVRTSVTVCKGTEAITPAFLPPACKLAQSMLTSVAHQRQTVWHSAGLAMPRVF